MKEKKDTSEGMLNEREGTQQSYFEFKAMGIRKLNELAHR